MLNQSFFDNAYGTLLTKVVDPSQVTDAVAPTWIRHEYSRRPAFNSDGSMAIMYSSGGWFRLYSVNKVANTFTFMKTLPVGGSVEPNWHATDPNVLFFLNNYGSGMVINSINVISGVTAVHRNLSTKIKAIFPNANRAWTKEEGRPSNDGKIWCFQVEDASYGMLGLVSYNMETDQILGSMASSVRPDHTSTSPSGKFCVPSWAYDKTRGTRAYTLDFKKEVQLHTMSEHSDLATSASGKDAYVFFDYDSGDIAMSEFSADASGQPVSARTNLFRIYGSNSSSISGHISGVAKNKPGYVVISFYNCTEDYGRAPCGANQWYKDKVVIAALKTNFNPTTDIYNLTHTNYGDAGYFSETQAVTSFDLSKVLFVSTWGQTAERNIASYMVDVPAASLDGAAPPQNASCSFNGTTVVHGATVLAFLANSVPNGSTCTSQSRTCNNGVLSGSYTYGSCTVQPPVSNASCSFNGATVAHGSSVNAFQAATVPNGSTCVNQTRTCNNGVLSGSYAYGSCSVLPPVANKSVLSTERLSLTAPVCSHTWLHQCQVVQPVLVSPAHATTACFLDLTPTVHVLFSNHRLVLSL